jgi:hypothetical protein
LSLTVLDSRTLVDGIVTEETSVLVVVRRDSSNPTHPNVVSVPTQRIPLSLFRQMRRADGAGDGDDTASGFVDSAHHNGHDPIVYATEALLARKFEWGEALETGRARFRALAHGCLDGTAIYEMVSEDRAECSEAIAMMNVFGRADRRSRGPAARHEQLRTRGVDIGGTVHGRRPNPEPGHLR